MICRGNRPILISNGQFQAWNTEQLWYLKSLGSIRAREIIEVVISYYLPDKRRTDLTNKTESLMDLMVDAGILEDDNCTIVPQLRLVYLGVDKLNPRAEIRIIQKPVS